MIGHIRLPLQSYLLLISPPWHVLHVIVLVFSITILIFLELTTQWRGGALYKRNNRESIDVVRVLGNVHAWVCEYLQEERGKKKVVELL